MKIGRIGKKCPLCGSTNIYQKKTTQQWNCYQCKTNINPMISAILAPKGSKRRQLHEEKIMTKQELIYRIKQCRDKKIRGLLATMYLSGARISELVKHIEKNQISVRHDMGTPTLVIDNVPILKRKDKVRYRSIPVNVDKEEVFINFIYDYLDELPESAILWDFSRNYAYRRVRDITGMYPHYFRHMRLTHLVKEYGMMASELRQFTGWSNEAPASVYVHLDWRHLAKKMSN